ncbi:MAG: riboflavin synthase [Endomicrobium sp.]|jgi:riboflavin synthase|nr:riboflavin synthase [Endomicrobium sp.]
MFTGLIEDIGVIKNISSSRIEIETTLNDISKGDSISVNGVCLTAVSINKNVFAADYSSHTDKTTTLSKLKKDSKVNLERALMLSSRLGGHIVSGHVDGTAKIEKIEVLKEFYKVKFLCKKNILNYCVNNGSIAVDGISLTIASILDYGFEIFIIPETFNNTIMQLKKTSDEVNIETDALVKYVDKLTKKETSNISFEMLKKNGFME